MTRRRAVSWTGALLRPQYGAILAVLLIALAGGCGTRVEPPSDPALVRVYPRVPEGPPGEPSWILVLLPGMPAQATREIVRSRENWRDLETSSLSLTDGATYPQPELSREWVSVMERAARDLVDPLDGVDVAIAAGEGAIRTGGARGMLSSDDPRVVALFLVEMLPDTTIRRLHASDAFTESFYESETKLIRRAVIHLPLQLLEWGGDDLANFFAHEFGHALGLGDHLEEMWNRPPDETWFWDRLMTVPIPRGQEWQPATIEDVLAIAGGRYRLRDDWEADRHLSFPDAVAYVRPRPGT